MTMRPITDPPGELGRLMKAVTADEVAPIEGILRVAPALASAADEQGLTALHIAACEGTAAAAQLLIERGAPIDAVERVHGSTPLGWAAYFGHVAVVERLLAAGADVAYVNSYGLSPAQIAAGGERGEHAEDAPHRTREEFAAIGALLEQRARARSSG